MYKKNHKKTCNKKNKKLRMKTVLCDGLNDAAQQLIVVDDVEQMKCKEVTVKHDPTDRHCHKHLHTHTHHRVGTGSWEIHIGGVVRIVNKLRSKRRRISMKYYFNYICQWKIWWTSPLWFLSYVSRETYRQTNKLIQILFAFFLVAQ